jgi:hypothetical protein
MFGIAWSGSNGSGCWKSRAGVIVHSDVLTVVVEFKVASEKLNVAEPRIVEEQRQHVVFSCRCVTLRRQE